MKKSPATVKLFNTMTRSLEEFIPLVPGEASIYCCGPTVYSFQHVGNFKTFIFEDLLARTLRFAGYKVKHVMNITDVGHLTGDSEDGEDKMLVAMRRENKSSLEISRFYTDKFFEDWDKLHLKRPDVVCYATQHIPEMIALIERIYANGLAYVANGNVYFDVSKYKNYGQLAKLDLENLKAGSRIEVDPHKRNPLDFVLWFTKSKFENQELQWDSPWGRGYPGWHIECSAMSIKYLGENFDIHCGGVDHVPVHHTNEIAQSEAATGKKWVNFWLHSEFILINDTKMSKSSGKTILLDDIIAQGHDPLVYRYFCLSANYRAQLNFTDESITGAANGLERLKRSVLNLKAEAGSIKPDSSFEHPSLQAFTEAVCNDLNMPQALSHLWKALGDKELTAVEKLALLYKMDEVLGLGIEEWKAEAVSVSAEADKLLQARQAARAAKDFKAADQIRDQLLALGFKVVDSADGPKLEKA